MIGINKGALGRAVNPNLKLELKFNYNTYTDLAGTVAANTNDYVRAWKSTVGGFLFTQSTDSARPQRMSDGLYFDGGDTLQVTVPANWYASDFTLELWANSDPMMAFSQINGGAFAAIVIVSSGIYMSYNGSSWAVNGLSIGGAGGAWTHFAVVGNGANVRTYKNGVQVASQAYTAGLYYNATNQIVLGKYYGSSYMTGKMTDIRFYTSCLYPNGTTFTPPTRSA